MRTSRWEKQRVKLGLRKAELAKLSNLSVRTIMRLEAGDSSITDVTKNKVKNALAKEAASLHAV